LTRFSKGCFVGWWSWVYGGGLLATAFQPGIERIAPAAHQDERQNDERVEKCELWITTCEQVLKNRHAEHTDKQCGVDSREQSSNDEQRADELYQGCRYGGRERHGKVHLRHFLRQCPRRAVLEVGN